MCVSIDTIVHFNVEFVSQSQPEPSHSSFSLTLPPSTTCAERTFYSAHVTELELRRTWDEKNRHFHQPDPDETHSNGKLAPMNATSWKYSTNDHATIYLSDETASDATSSRDECVKISHPIYLVMDEFRLNQKLGILYSSVDWIENVTLSSMCYSLAVIAILMSSRPKFCLSDAWLDS